MKLEHKTAKSKKINVLIPVDTIDDIYSDFDLRELTIRSLSNDFINEVKQQSKVSGADDRIFIKIVAPLKVKSKEFTKKIQHQTKKRILEYFNDQYNTLSYQRRITMIKALVFIIGGLGCFFITKLVPVKNIHNLFLKMAHELIVFFSWFATWNGIDTFSDRGSKREARLLKRISDASIQFSFVKKFGI